MSLPAQTSGEGLALLKFFNTPSLLPLIQISPPVENSDEDFPITLTFPINPTMNVNSSSSLKHLEKFTGERVIDGREDTVIKSKEGKTYCLTSLYYLLLNPSKSSYAKYFAATKSCKVGQIKVTELDAALVLLEKEKIEEKVKESKGDLKGRDSSSARAKADIAKASEKAKAKALDSSKSSSSDKHHKPSEVKPDKIHITEKKLMESLVKSKGRVTDNTSTTSDSFSFASCDVTLVTPDLLSSSIKETIKVFEIEKNMTETDTMLSSRGQKRDLSLANTYYDEIRATEKKKKEAAKDPKKAKLLKESEAKELRRRSSMGNREFSGSPIIIVPSAMTSAITLPNALDFLSDSTFVQSSVKMSSPTYTKEKKLIFTRRFANNNVNQSSSGKDITFEIIDNPARLSSSDWKRVVSIVASGQTWQFKSWNLHTDPVKLFDEYFGIHITMEGQPVPKEVEGWGLKVLRLNRDNSGANLVAASGFWNSLEEWMKVKRPGILE